jgi:hypothetical protein
VKAAHCCVIRTMILLCDLIFIDVLILKYTKFRPVEVELILAFGQTSHEES